MHLVFLNCVYIDKSIQDIVWTVSAVTIVKVSFLSPPLVDNATLSSLEIEVHFSFISKYI